MNNTDTPKNTNMPNLLIDINSPTPNIWEINIHIRITYVVNTAHKAGFTSLVNIIKYQLSNFSILQIHILDVIQSIICKFKLE